MLVGYARVSTDDQPQMERAQLPRALDHVRESDTLVVGRLDRLGAGLV